MTARSPVASSTVGALEVQPGDRRALRRSVQMECEILAEAFDDTVTHTLTELSPFGAWIETIYPLEPGAELLVSLTPPGGQGASVDVVLTACVARASLGRRRGEVGRSGMGVSFDASEGEYAQLSEALLGLPPPLPAACRGAVESGIAWVDMPVVYEEEYDDRTNILIVLETVACFLDEADGLLELEPERLVAAAPLLTGGSSAPRWNFALPS